MGDYDIIKVIVCMFLHWNPMSEEVMKIPSYMWPIYYRMHTYTMMQTYDRMYKPQAELIASIVNPEMYQKYYDKQEAEIKIKSGALTGTHTVTENGVTHSTATADTYFDPEKGLVDFNGNILISKEDYLTRVDSGGIIISK